jgi:hypothetical protein
VPETRLSGLIVPKIPTPAISLTVLKDRFRVSKKGPGGAEGNRTPDLLIANEALYHLSYGPLETQEGAE